MKSTGSARKSTSTTPSQKRAGKAFESEFAKSLESFRETRNPHFWWKRWPDYRDFIAINRHLFAPRAPADFTSIYRGTTYFWELKSTRGTRYVFDWIKEHQKDTLLALELAGARAYLVFEHRVRPMRCTVIPISEYICYESIWESGGKKSVPIDVLMSTGIPLERDGVGWNISEILEDEKNDREAKRES